ncbi:MAG: lysozyme [Burkholderiaceae bacterium]|nr:lysozyme [Burkholderiaceae bacterium]
MGDAAPSAKQARVDALLARELRWPCDKSAVEMIALEEDCRLEAYRDIAGVWTCGWGETDGVSPGARWTQDHADARLLQSLHQWAEGVRRAIGDAPANANQFAAMLCLAYNIGLNGFAGSTVCRLHKAGDYAGAARAFTLWNKVRDPNYQLRISPALTERRKREAARYREPVQEPGQC